MSRILNNNSLWLTNFCGNTRIFVSIIMIQIVVLIYSLSFLSFDLDFLHKFAALTLVAHFIGLTLLILLCKLRGFFNRFNVVAGVLIIILMIAIVTSLMAQIIGFLDMRLTFRLILNREDVNYLNLKLVFSYAIIFLALIRYFYIQDQWQKQVNKLNDARLIALQARIKPHFLFNSLNSISSLITIDAERAEKAMEDFSGLMRRGFSFKSKDKFITVKEELHWIKQYLAIEKLRLDKRLKYNINCDGSLLENKIPVLVVQPMVENAILHGIQPLEHGGTIEIDIRHDAQLLYIRVTNPYKRQAIKNFKSNGMALKNIEERLQLQYGSKAQIHIDKQTSVFSISIGIPL